MKQNKKCIKCLGIKEVSLFYLRKGASDGHHNYCKECHNKLNRQSIRNWQQSYRGKEYMKEHNSLYREDNKEKIREYNKVYARSYNKTEKGLAQRKIIDKRKRENPKFRVDSNFSRAIRFALGGRKNYMSWKSLVDYSLADLTKHLESQFDDKMTWENYGSYWHIDHIVPRSYFKYVNATEDAFKKCWALSNLQPLEAIENIKKGNKLYATNC